jgi:hypothetical protein
MRKAALMAKFTRDIVKDCVCATGDSTDYMLLAVENQSYVDGLMPARVMIYDAMTFHIQMEALKVQIQAQQSSDEFLTGVPKNTKLKPVVTVVCYFGTQPWDGPRSLHEILEIHDPGLKSFIPDYPIHIIDPHRLTDKQMQCLETSLREVFLCLKASPHSKSLKEIVNSSHRFQHMDPDAIHLINTLLDIDIPVDDQKKENNMCQAVEEWKQELRDEGYANGEKAGYANGEKAGYANGEKAGYANGEKAGYANGEKAGYANGEKAGYANGEKAGYANGEKAGYANGEKAGYANGEKAGYANGEKAGYANGKLVGEKAILKTLIQNSGLSLSEIAQMTNQPIALLQTLAAQ